MTGITFAPMVPVPLILLLVVAAIGLIGYGVWRRARGVLLRTLPILALLIAISDPELMRENRTPLQDVAVVVVDESASQQLGERSERTVKVLERLRENLNGADDLEVRVFQRPHCCDERRSIPASSRRHSDHRRPSARHLNARASRANSSALSQGPATCPADR